MSTNSAIQKRQPAGRPVGGEFATETKPGSGVSLQAPAEPQVTGRGEWEDTDDGEDENYQSSQRVLETNEAFNARVRLLLGAGDPHVPVTVAEAESSVNPWGCETWESVEWVQVSASDQTRCFESLPELLAHLEFADREPLEAETIYADLGRDADWVIKDRRGGVHRFRGRIGNARGNTVVIMVPGPWEDDNRRLPDADPYSSTGQETLIRTDLRTIVGMDVDYSQATCMHCKQTVTDPGEIDDQRCTSCTDERRCADCGTYSSILSVTSESGDLCGACDRRRDERDLEKRLLEDGLSPEETRSIVYGPDEN